MKFIALLPMKENLERVPQKNYRLMAGEPLFFYIADKLEKLVMIINNLIVDDLMVEDRLNDEVKQLLDSRTKEYERSMMDYGRVFQLVKSKLARERGLIF